jgi:G3E family GTPase
MDTFDEWVKGATQFPCLQKWADRLIELGASWDSFRRDQSHVVDDLVQGGIPLLAARDIVDIASATVKRSCAPMAVFWDLENMPIPATSSGRDVTSRLKSILAPHGDLVQFRGYASIGLGLIPQSKRSDLQLSGCHLVDCPHNGRKEVADKMIIVDAMQFAFLHPEAATLCFITEDVDYAYLLAVLQRPQWRTIVISKGTMQSMLHVNCDMKMRWETDILLLRYAVESAPPGFDPEDDKGLPSATETGPEDSFIYRNARVGRQLNDSTDGAGSQTLPFEPLTADEEWEDDVELLRTVVKREGGSIDAPGVLKSLVGSSLRHTNPARFPHREAIRSFFTQAIAKGAVIETGEGATKLLSLPSYNGKRFGPSMPLSDRAPVDLGDIPERVVEVSAKMPFVLFFPSGRIPSGTLFPKRTFVQFKSPWVFLLFQTLVDAQWTVTELPWLLGGTLVDWHAVEDAKEKMVECYLCNALRQPDEMVAAPTGETAYSCPECKLWSKLDSAKKEQVIQWVVSMLQMMAENDDVYIAENILIKQLHLLHSEECASRKLVSLWIQEAVTSGNVLFFKRPNTKTKLVCLTTQQESARAPFPPDDIDTSKEEYHVEQFLWEAKGRVTRIQLVESLRANFQTMQTPLLRTKVFLNGEAKNRFFIAKGASGQMVGLTKEQAAAALNENTTEPQRQFELLLSNGTVDDAIVAAKGTDKTQGGEPGGEDESTGGTGSSAGEHDHEAILARVSTCSTDCKEACGDKAASVSTKSSIEEALRSVSCKKQSYFNRIQDSNGNPATRNLYVKGYGPFTTPRQLRSIFSEFASVMDVVPKFGNMFVNTASKREAILARERLSGTTLNGGVLEINFAKF